MIYKLRWFATPAKTENPIPSIQNRKKTTNYLTVSFRKKGKVRMNCCKKVKPK